MLAEASRQVPSGPDTVRAAGPGIVARDDLAARYGQPNPHVKLAAGALVAMRRLDQDLAARDAIVDVLELADELANAQPDCFYAQPRLMCDPRNFGILQTVRVWIQSKARMPRIIRTLDSQLAHVHGGGR